MIFGTVLHPLRLALALAGLLLAGLLASGPARADLRVCNETSNQVSIAMGYLADKGWESEGWWVAPPSKCAIVYQGDLHSRFFYLYVADDIGGGAWDGDVSMCTTDESFTIFGVENCLARGFEKTGFFEVDTQNRADWTMQLTDNTGAEPETGTDDIAPADGDTTDAGPADDGSNDGGDQPGDVPADGGGDTGTD